MRKSMPFFRVIQNRDQKGGALVMAIVLLVVTAAAAAGIARLSTSTILVTSERLNSERAFYAAESARLVGGYYCDEPMDLAPELQDLDLHGCQDVGDVYLNVEQACGSTNAQLYLGWVGSEWDDAQARHAACFKGVGPPGWEDVDWDKPENAYNPDASDIRHGDFDNLALTEDRDGIPHVEVRRNLYINSKVTGTSHWNVCSDSDSGYNGEGSDCSGSSNTCFGDGVVNASAGWSGQATFNGNVYFESDSARDSVDQGGGPDYRGCIYVAGELVDDSGENCDPDEDPISHEWCGIGGFDEEAGGWGYARP